MEFITSENRYYLVGREQVVKELFTRFGDDYIVLLLGDSGVGKTSLIHAGLIPEVGNLDGSYSRSLQFSPRTLPSISIKIYGQETIGEFELAPVDSLHYVDQVIAFRKGREGEEGANKYSDPQAVLGDVTEKDREQFVSLGGFGLITIGFQGQAILATDESNDITIFVQRNQGLRPYLVEAMAAGCKRAWFELGTSSGVTQSFSLGRAGVQTAIAIRISDKSGFTVDKDFRAIPSPGVSVRGVGAKRVGQRSRSGLKGCLGKIMRIVTLGFMRRKSKTLK